LIDSVSIPAYAKVNYTLDVLSPRPDGYHNIASVLQTVSLADTVELRLIAGNRIEIECDAPDVPADSTNLAYRAAEVIRSAVSGAQGIGIRLTKRVPSQAGLGGGSSDAAATLRGVNMLLDAGYSDERFTEIAAGLGSDVPFFLTGGTAAVRGRGEQLTALPDGPPFWFVIVKPDSYVSTPRAYRTLDEMPERKSARATRDVESLVRSGDMERLAARMTNDFEQAVVPEHDDIMLAMDDLTMARARNVRLCGSGSAVFGLAFSRPEAEEIGRIMRLKYEQVHVCRAITRDESLSVGTTAE
jgi:4-diphosphocytidyl-2-C-methyl-D-erythritol kinase